jgi:signal transduction histidine kinase
VAPSPLPVSFRPSARLQKYLGQELIADPNLAIIEFIKNAYDAGATHTTIEFILTDGTPRLIVADNGSGMTENEFRDNWMRPGFSHKAQNAPPRPSAKGPGARSQARQLERARIPAGEKGLGRMAAGRLGTRLDVYTRPSPEVPWLHVPFDWAKFDDMTKPMDEVTVTPDFESTPPPSVVVEAGTIVVISGLRQKWDGRVRGRPVAGRARTKLGRLKQDLEFFVRPLHPDYGDFAIDLQSDSAANPDDLGHVTTWTAAQAADYEYSFRFEKVDSRAQVSREVRRSENIAVTASKPMQEDLGAFDLVMEDSDGASGPAPLACGPFYGKFLYSPPPAASRATVVLPMGVLLYRDGVWVEPYGIDEDDWLGIAARKAQRQGHAAIQPNTMTGYVNITRDDNPNLEDMSNRMGLLENDEAEEFLHHVREEFRFFEQMVYEEVLEKRWEGKKAKKAGDAAAEDLELASLFLRNMAHSIRQPLAGLQMELSLIDAVVDNSEVPKAIREQLRESRSRSREHLRRANDSLEQTLDLQAAEFSTVPIRQIVEAAVAHVSVLAGTLGVSIECSLPSGTHDVLVPPGLVEHALAGILANAVEAPRPKGTLGTVTVLVPRVEGDPRILISDNGTGIPDFRLAGPLAAIESTKGRPAQGLRLAELGIAASRGRLSIEVSSPTGTLVQVLLPDRQAGLRD